MLRNLCRIRLAEVKNVFPKINIVTPYLKIAKVKILPENKSFKNHGTFLIGAGVFTWLGFGNNENVEDEIILNIKRSILWIQQKEYEKAEQMLHIALRLAQQTFNELAITYVYDIMANLALQRNQLDKAEKLFVSVMQRLLSTGVAESDNRNVHISLKLAHICHLKGDLDRSVIGFEWALDHLERKKRDSVDTLTLYGLGKDWYGHLLFDLKRYEESLTNLSEAFDILNEVQEENFEQIVVLLNDMAAINEKLGKVDKAIELLEKSVVIAKKNPETCDVGTVHVNLGRIYMRKGLYEKARKSCGKGWRYSSDKKNDQVRDEASKCIKEAMKLGS